ncbi:hypothetical protein F2Q69_00051471 [Brassica cretica]|uniref:Protein kinase domain-containing protein n=1 Tax=Brassica cretica TaxID=69181 RepID=A0A8S9PNL1_BRACR|nr:hypothetical protein F2Q69_00051471 [Brassica cretica]
MFGVNAEYGGALPWLTRVKILLGAAKGLDFLHKGKKPVIYRDFKPSNILLSSDYNSKLSDFGLATDGSEAEDSNFTKSVMGTEGYAAPEYISTDPNKLERIIDPSLEGRYSLEGIRKAASLAYQCLSHNPKSRPTMTTVVKTLGPILDLKDIQNGPFVYIVPVAGANDITCKDDDAKVTKEETEKEAKVCPRHRAGRRRRRKHRAMKSRAVYSDTTLYKSLGTSLYTQAELDYVIHTLVMKKEFLIPHQTPEGIRKAASLAYQCLSHNPKSRPTMTTVVKTLGPILDLKDIQNGPFVYIVPVAGANDITCKDDDAKVTKEETEKEAKVCPRHRAGRRRRRKHRAMKSRAVYSDTTLYKSLGTSLYTQAE